jgi:hypothetical protein
MGCLYKLTSPSGKSYIGISRSTAGERWVVHQLRTKEGRNYALQQAIRKYGAGSFIVETLAESDEWDALCEMERLAIIEHGTKTPLGYNLTDGGEGVVGRVVTDESRHRMSNGQKKRCADPAERARLIALGRRNAEKARKPRLPKRAIGAATKGLWQDQAYRDRMTVAIRTAANRVDAKANHRRAAAQRAKDPQWRERQAEARRREWEDPNTRIMRAAQLAKAREALALKRGLNDSNR